MPRSDPPTSKQSADVARLNAKLTAMIEESRALRDVLVRNERAAAKLQRHLARSGSVLDAMEALEGAMRGPRELPDAIEHFETTRREARHALFSLATKQDVSMSEMARRFGFSRQLASRLVRERESGRGTANARTGSR
jgi:AraC-like DNA-binding protein